MGGYILAVDQSTQGTKGLLFDERGTLIARADRPHRQIVNDRGWVEHDPMEILNNTAGVCGDVLRRAGVSSAQVAGLALSNQRETSLMWDKGTGKPIYNAVVWQCARASEICERPEIASQSETIRQKTGINLSPYFPAAKLCWLMENVPAARELASQGRLACGTVDSWLVWNLTGNHWTDCSNASRTQLFNITELNWDGELCALFHIPPDSLPEVRMSDENFGLTDLCGVLDHRVPVHAVLGDSHAALFGQNCRRVGLTKATYGTGSSIMMNVGRKPVFSRHGLVTSLAWGIGGEVEYVLEGNLNYTGAVITWLKDSLGLISSPGESEVLARSASQNDGVYLVPAFTGLGAPYWDSAARASVVGMDRTTGRAELVRAGLECIAYQIADVVFSMREDSGLDIGALRVDGGPTRNRWLMQFQSDILRADVSVPAAEELSGIGAAYLAGMALGLWDEGVFARMERSAYTPLMDPALREEKYAGWKRAVQSVLQNMPTAKSVSRSI